MSSSETRNTKLQAAEVWRDALGPGYAVGVAESVLRVAGTAANQPYKGRRSA